MSALKIQDTLEHIESNMAELAPYRKPALFNEFLVKGYTAVTLSSVPCQIRDDLLRAKVCLGTLITLYDDYADRPSQFDPHLLESLYRLGFADHESDVERRQGAAVLSYARALFAEIHSVIKNLPRYRALIDILGFDLSQFYSANRYSSLLTAHEGLHNRLENRAYAHHNMGMVIVAMFDVMASEGPRSELGSMREVFLMGQRMGRIFNVLATRRREEADGDRTGELAICAGEIEIENAQLKLRHEVRRLSEIISSRDRTIKTFSVNLYLEGLLKLQKLHESMEGIL